MRSLQTWLGTFLVLVAAHQSLAADDNGPNAEREKELIALLQSDAPAADKALACKHLTVHGSAAAVPELAKLLGNEQLASWARIPLEAIPAAEADQALREATGSLTGRLLVGTINSIGVRRDKGAVEVLSARLSDEDAEVASAAAVALGRIGGDGALKALQPLLATAPNSTRSAIAEGVVLCAEQTLAAGQNASAVAIYDSVRNADVPKQRILEATRGAILARDEEAGIALLIEQLRSSDMKLVQIGLMTAREFPGRAIDKALAQELDSAVPERAALVILAMADRPESVVLPAILKSASKGQKISRMAAISVLARVGDETCLSALLDAAVESDAEIAQSARTALGELPGKGVDQSIVSRLAKADGSLYLALIELVGQRRIQAVAELQKALGHQDKTVRAAALTSLGETVPQKNLSILISQAVSPKKAEDAAVAQQALMTASVRMPDREVCAAELSAAMSKAPVATQTTLLNILGSVGGTKALQTIGASAKSPEPELQDSASRLLGEWLTPDAAPVLLDLAKTAPEDKFKVRALRGYIRIARIYVPAEPERLEMCQKALELARNANDQKPVLEVLKKYPTVDALKLALKLTEAAELKDDGTQAVMFIAQKLGTKNPEVTELLSQAGLAKVKLEILKAEYGAGDMKKDVTEDLRKAASSVQLISLPSSRYNEVFGGDPAPSTVKQLKVQYKINGKEGTATFAEDALIVLPVPK